MPDFDENKLLLQPKPLLHVAARGANLYLQDHGDPVWYRAFRMRTIPANEIVQASTDFKPADIPAEMLDKESQFIENKKKAGK